MIGCATPSRLLQHSSPLCLGCLVKQLVQQTILGSYYGPKLYYDCLPKYKPTLKYPLKHNLLLDTIDSSNKQNTDRIEQLHKRAIRKIENKSGSEQKEDYTLLLKTYGLTTLYQRRTEHLLLFIYKKSKIDKESLNTQRPKMELRSRNKVKLKHMFTDKSKVMNSPFYQGIFLWNKLSPEIQKV